MKILFLANHFGTLYFFRRELIKKLVDLGNDVFVSIPQDENNYFKNLGCHFIQTTVDRRGVNPIKDLFLIFRYKQIMEKIRPEFILSYTIKPNIYGCIANGGKYKQVCNITGTGATFIENNLTAKICKFLYKLSVKNCYKLLFQNNGDKIFFENNNLVNQDYEVIPGSGCNLEDNKYKEMNNFESLSFIFVGRVMEVKGIQEYLDMAKFIKSQYHNIKFYVAGWVEEDYWKSKLMDYQNEGIIEYLGFVKDIKNWIYRCHCTILPSHGGEGTPNVILESAAAGRPCIGSKVAGTEDAIIDGKTGYLFKAGDTQDLIRKVEMYIHLKEEEKLIMGRCGRNLVEDKYDRKIVVNKYLDIMKVL